MQMVVPLMAEHGLSDQSWVFRLDHSVSRAGCCNFTRRTISLSKHLVNDTTHSLDDVRNILLHEIAHALAGPTGAHGPEWRAIALRIGCDGERCHSLDLKPFSQILACVLCGHVNALRHRVCREYWNRAACTSCSAVGSLTCVSRKTWLAIVNAAPPVPPVPFPPPVPTPAGSTITVDTNHSPDPVTRA